MLMKEIEYVKPESIAEAVQILESRRDGKCLAGGQSLVNVMKLRLASPGLVVDLNGLSELRTISKGDADLRIGAMATYRTVAEDPLVQRYLPVVADVAAHIGDRQVRNRGTIGGNCCFNDPTSNFPPLLSVLQAKFEIAGHSGQVRVVDAPDFFVGPYQTAVGKGELLAAVKIPIPTGTWGARFLSLRVGNDGPAILHTAAYVSRGESLDTVRVAIGCVEGAPYRLKDFEEAAIAENASPERIGNMLHSLPLGIRGLSDSHGSASYREEMARVLARRAIEEALQQAERI